MSEKLKVGILGGTGMVGQRFIALLENHPWFEVTTIAASPRSAGKTYKEAVGDRWKMDTPMPEAVKDIVVKNVNEVEQVSAEVDFVFSAVDMTKEEIKKIEEDYARAETPVVSNNSAHRWTPDVPMVVPEINPEHFDVIEDQKKRLGTKRGFIAVKPNCSIQSYAPVLTAWKEFEPYEVVATTYQAISGAGKTFKDWPEMVENVIPYIGGEEEKSEKEPLRLWGKVENGQIVPADIHGEYEAFLHILKNASGNIKRKVKELFGNNTCDLKVLKEKEKIELLKKARNGDKKAREDLIKGNLRLVLSVIQRFQNRGESMDDLFQVGVIGLIKAIDNFNLDLDVKFSTYAVPMCIGEIRRFLRDDAPIRVSRSMKDTAYKAMQVKEKLTNKNHKEPTVEEIAKELGLKKADVVLALEAIVDPVSLYEPVYNDGGDTIFVMDQVGDSNTDSDWIDEIMIKDEINKLGKREQNIMYLRFMQGKTQMEVAQEVGISQAQVSRLEKNALKKIKGH